jgi:hypothetical protein
MIILPPKDKTIKSYDPIKNRIVPTPGPSKTPISKAAAVNIRALFLFTT